MTRYRVEIYDKDFNFRAFSEVSSKSINIDYMVLGTSTVVVPHIVPAYENDFIVLKADGQEQYAGLVTSTSYGEHQTEITVRSFMSLLDTDVFVDISRLENEAIEDVIAGILTDMFDGADATQAITGFSCAVNSQTVGVTIGEDYIYNLFDLSIFLLKKIGVLFKFVLDIQNRTLTCQINALDPLDVKVIKASVADVNECVIDVRTIQADYNKAVYFNEEDLTESITYYLHTDGTIDTDSTVNRFYPVNQVQALAAPDNDEDDPKTFQQMAYEDALSTLSATEYENEIDVTVKADSKLIEIGDIGQFYQIISYNGVVYTSILTGFQEVNPKYVTLKLGYVRTDLTSIIKMRRRNAK